MTVLFGLLKKLEQSLSKQYIFFHNRLNVAAGALPSLMSIMYMNEVQVSCFKYEIAGPTFGATVTSLNQFSNSKSNEQAE